MKKFPFHWLVLAAVVFANNAKATTVFPIATNPAVVEVSGGIATCGTNYYAMIVSGTNLVGQLIGTNGTLIGGQTNIGFNPGFPPAAALAFGQTNYLVAWSDSSVSAGVDMFGQFVSRSGAKVGSKFNLLSSQGSFGFQYVRALASDGTNFVAVWQDDNNQNFYGQLITPSGTLSGTAFLIDTSPSDNPNPGTPNGNDAAITFGKTNYLVAWMSGNGSQNADQTYTYAEFISTTGVAGNPFQISQTVSTDQNPLALAFDGTNYLAVWPWDPGPETEMNVTNWQLYARLVAQSGTLVGSELKLITNRNDVIPSLAFDGTDYLLTYGFDSNTTNSDRNLYCQFIDRSASLAGPFFVPFTTQGTNVPLFAFNGTVFDGKRFAVAAALGTLGGFAESFGAFIPASTTPPTLTASNLVGTQFPLQLTGTPGITYAIQISTNLALSNWTAVVTNSPTNGTFSFTDTHATNASRFYRAVKQ